MRNVANPDRRLCISRELVLYPLVMRHLHLGVERLRPFIEAVTAGLAKGAAFTAAVLRAADEYPELASCFDLATGTLEDSFGLRPEYLFPARDEIAALSVQNRRSRRGFQVASEADIAAFGDILALCAAGERSERELRDLVSDESIDELLAFDALEETSAPRLQVPPAPGIVRLQHASLLYRSKSTGILVDPHVSSSYEKGVTSTFGARDLRSLVDAIVISHSHEDHWSPTSLLQFPRDLPIIVPHVPRPSLLAHDMAHQLRSLGFTNVMSPKWYSRPITIGDFEIHVLPFYGEQPLRDRAWRHADLRNWGNTYYLKTASYSSWFLIDSGDDVSGRMSEVAEHVSSRLGGVDFLLSNLRMFSVGSGVGSPWYITGSGHYWLALAARQAAVLPSIRDSITLGPQGVAEVARVARAKTFLPYAHWWCPLGETPRDDAELSELRRFAAPTLDLRSWAIGDGYFLSARGCFERRRCHDVRN